MSLAVHHWSSKEKGPGFLRKTIMTDSDFDGVFKLHGPGSLWRILGNITLPEIKQIWRNPLQGSGFLSGHFLNGFQNQNGVHSLTQCHFKHCFEDLSSNWCEGNVQIKDLTKSSDAPAVRQLFTHDVNECS